MYNKLKKELQNNGQKTDGPKNQTIWGATGEYIYIHFFIQVSDNPSNYIYTGKKRMFFQYLGLEKSLFMIEFIHSARCNCLIADRKAKIKLDWHYEIQSKGWFQRTRAPIKIMIIMSHRHMDMNITYIGI